MMRKLILSILFVMLAIPVMAAGTITFTTVDTYGPGTTHWMKITATCTASSSDGTYPVTQISPLRTGGMWLYSVNTYYGATGPTDNSDLQILEGSSSGKDILNGAGTDMIDNATNNIFQPELEQNTPGYGIMPIFDDLYIKITNNSVNSAVTTIVMRFIQ